VSAVEVREHVIIDRRPPDPWVSVWGLPGKDTEYVAVTVRYTETSEGARIWQAWQELRVCAAVNQGVSSLYK